MDNFDPYNVLLAIATNIPVLLMTALVLQGHIYVCAVYIYYVYINTHTCMYIIKKNVMFTYDMCIYNIKYIHVNPCKYFQNIYCIVYFYIHNKYTQYTHIYYVNKNFYFGCD